MKRQLSTLDARELLRPDVPDHWSWEGALALIEYLENLEDSSGISIEFDRIALRCEYSEYESALEADQDYDFIPPEDEDDEDEIEAAALKYLQDRTTVIEFEGGVIIQQF